MTSEPKPVLVLPRWDEAIILTRKGSMWEGEIQRPSREHGVWRTVFDLSVEDVGDIEALLWMLKRCREENRKPEAKQ